MKLKRLAAEATLIIFSVFLALGLNEFRENYINLKKAEKAEANVLLEISRNKKIISELLDYHDYIIDIIDKYSYSDSLKSTLLNENGFQITKLVPKGIDTRIVSKTAWEVAKSHDLTQHVNLDLATCLIKCYDQQDHVNRYRDRILEILSDRSTNKVQELDNTIIILYKYYTILRAQEEILMDYYDELARLKKENQ